MRFENRRSGLTRPGSVDKRPVREIVGVDERLATTWSKRHSAIEARRRELAAAFQAEHGRPPTEGEAVTLAEKAWEQTRQAKHAPRAEADQRAAWLAEAAAIIGSEQAVRDMVEDCLGHRPDAQDVTDDVGRRDRAEVVARVAEDRATWQVWHLRAEAQRQARAHGIRLTDLDTAVDRVVATAIADHSIAFNDPDPLTHATTAAELGRDDPRSPAAHRARRRGRGGRQRLQPRRRPPVHLPGRHRRRTAHRRGRPTHRRPHHQRGPRRHRDRRSRRQRQLQLNAAQQSLVREMATSGRAVQLALAPAGTGKTTAMQVLTRAWQDSGGTVIGLAPSAVAAQELGASINPEHTRRRCRRQAKGLLRGPWRPGRKKVRADTLAKLVWHAQTRRTHPRGWRRSTTRPSS